MSKYTLEYTKLHHFFKKNPSSQCITTPLILSKLLDELDVNLHMVLANQLFQACLSISDDYLITLMRPTIILTFFFTPILDYI